MSISLRNTIAYWFFLIVGMVGVAAFGYEFWATDNYTFWEWISITAAFSVFIFRPMILVDVFNSIRGLILNQKKDEK